MLNHFPVVGLLSAHPQADGAPSLPATGLGALPTTSGCTGLPFAPALLGGGALRENSSLAKAGFAALLAVPVFLTGEPAEKIAEPLPGVSHHIIEQHEEVAKVAFIVTLAAGVAALAGLWLARGKAVASWCASSVLIVALVAAGLMTWAANLGGKVRHTEIRRSAPVASAHEN